MRNIAKNLSALDKDILSNLRYANAQSAVPIFREEHGCPIFNFRDFGRTPLEWICENQEYSANAVNRSLSNLLEAIYAEPTMRVSWHENSIFVFDNFKFLHAKPESLSKSANLVRHLDRVRIGNHSRLSL